MNRLVLIGNGFDLAHGLNTSYKDFIDWYWELRVKGLMSLHTKEDEDILCKLSIKENKDFPDWFNFFYKHNFFYDSLTHKKTYSIQDIILYLQENPDYFSVEYSPLFGRIIKSIETKKWVDIENDYYSLLYDPIQIKEDKSLKELNEQLDYIKKLLAEYLLVVQNGALSKSIINKDLKDKMFAPIKLCEIAVSAQDSLRIFIKNRLADPEFNIKDLYERWDKEWNLIVNSEKSKQIKNFEEILKYIGIDEFTDEEIPDNFLFPHNMMLLNFNYTEIADQYIKNSIFDVNHIHGDLNNVEGMIFGYGDELDENYKKIQNLNNNEYLKNSKSVRYLEADNYRNMLNFIESGPYQIYIMGHSCGNSDRTLLNTLFEHQNCASIKPFYYKKDDNSDTYLEIVQNISRNFTNMKLMRDRVVNKKYCEALLQV